MLVGSLIFVLILSTAKGQSEFHFLPGTSMFSKDRDGIIIVTLNSGVNATVCNIGFTDIYAAKACSAMGYPMKGLTVLTKKSKMVKGMSMVAIKCTGSEASLKSCTIVTDGRILRKCKDKSRFAHVFCMQQKIKPIMKKFSSLTRCEENVSEKRIRLLRIPGKKNTGFLQLKESNSHDFRFVCNKYLNLGLAQARLFCKLLCQHPVNPRPVMYMNPESTIQEDGYFKDMNCPDEAESLDQCQSMSEGNACDKNYNLALQCGEETKRQDPVPHVICSNRSMLIEWSRNQTFFINSTLVSLHPNHTKDCLYTKTDSYTNVIIKIPLDYCNPIITDHDTTVSFKYTLDRFYSNDGVVQFKTKESIELFCEIPKVAQIVKEYVHGEVTYPPIKNDTRLSVTMNLYTGSDFLQLLPFPYDIQFYTTVFAKAVIVNPLNQIKLSLSNCFVTSADSYTEMTALNSAKIIDDNCPVEKYNVQIVPVNKWSIGFQFTSFKLLESNKASVNIFCETMKCIIIDDPDCGICKTKSYRKRRSAQSIKPDVIRAGPISLH